jgi:NADH dehydrogenase
MQWAIVRPTLIFGTGDVLINNIAWLLRYMPFFVIPESGRYRVQPVAGEDVADIATWAASRPSGLTVDAAGPEIITYGELVDSVAIAIRLRRRIVHLPARLTLIAGDAVGLLTRDIVLTRQELVGLMEELLVSQDEPRGTRRLDDWLLGSADSLGRSYASELSRHFR